MSQSRTPLGATQSLSLKGYSSSGSSRVASASVTLTPGKGAQVVNLTGLSASPLGSIVTLYVDNSTGPVPVEIVYPDTGMTTVVPAYSQGMYPALTSGLIITVSAPLIGVLGQAFMVDVQATNFPLPQAGYGPFLPNENSGVLASVGNAAGWQTFNGTVPLDGGAARLFTALEIDHSGYAGQLSIAGTSIDGGAWTVAQMPLQRGEFAVAATASATPIIATASIPLGGNTTALIPIRWRVQPSGGAPSYTTPLYMPWLPFSWTSLPAGTTIQGAFPAAAGSGVYLDKISITASGWSSQFNVLISDAGYPGGHTIFEETFPSGNVTYGNDLGYVSYVRDAAINIEIGNAGAATGTLLISLRGALLPASQNG